MSGITLRGEARAIVWHGEYTSWHGEHSPTTVTFRLMSYAPDGTPRQQVAVRTFSSRGLTGPLAEGDQVMVRGQWRHGVVVARSVHNLTTGAPVNASRGGPSAGCVIPLVVVGFLAVMAFVIAVVAGADQRNRQEEDAFGGPRSAGAGLVAIGGEPAGDVAVDWRDAVWRLHAQ